MNFNQWINELDLQIGNPHFAWLMVCAVAAIAVSVWAGVLRKRALKRFGTTGRETGNQSSFSRFASTLAIVLSIIMLSLALMDIRWGKTTYEVPQKGLEVVFALDVSRSMLAEDASPNRLSRAKQQIKDMVDEMAGDRVGLVVFAGQSEQAVPLTSHYDDFKQILDTVGPHTIPVGGSQLGGALTAAAEAFISKTNEHKTIVLFTDGEDQESEPVRLAKQLHADEGIRVFTVGLGDLDQGARIPDDQSFLQHDGQQVWSKLNGRILKEIATETNAAYIPAGTKRVNMADVYHGYVAKVEQTEFETAKINAYVPRYQWFAGAALLCLLTEIWLANGRKRKQTSKSARTMGQQAGANSNQRNTTSTSGRPSKIAAAAITFAILFPASALAQHTDSVASQINQANDLVRQQKTTEAIDAYNRIDSASKSETRNQLDYNLAIAHYRNSDYAAAMTLFSESAKSQNRTIAARSRHNLGNCHYAQALPLVESQPDAAIEQLNESIAHYRSGLRLDRSNADSRSNIELARKLIEQIQDQQQEDQQKEDQEQQNQDQQNQDQQNQDQQNQDQQNQEQQNQDQQNQDGQQQNEQESQQNDSNQEQQDSQNEQDSSRNEQNSEPQSSENSEQQDSESNSDSEPDDNQNQTNPRQNNQPQDQGKEQDEQQANAADKQPDDKSKQPEKTTGELTADNQGEEEKGNAQAIQPKQADEKGLMTREEALKMLQAIRDRDMLRRFQQQRRQRSRRVPVEKDW